MMNTRSRILSPFFLLFVIFSSAAIAGGTAQVNVNANVVGTCQFNTGTSGAIDFSLDPSSGADATGNVTQQPQFWCTNGTTYTITDDGGLHNTGTTYAMLHATSPAIIPYTLTYTASGAGTGKTTPISLNIAGTVLNADFVDAPAGNYSDTVTLTITP